MRPPISCLLAAVLALGAPAQQALEPRLQAALTEVQQRDPEAFRGLQQALKQDPDRARRALEHHARYLEEMRAAQASDPRRHAVMVAQEQMERRARQQAQVVHASPPGPERDAAESALRRLLQEWFEVRQQLRAFQVDVMERELQKVRDGLAATAADPAAAMAQWLDRIARQVHEGGAPSVFEPQEAELQALAPSLVQAVMRRDPVAGRELAQLAERAPPEFLARIREISTSAADLLAEARATAGEEVARRLELQAAIGAVAQALAVVPNPDPEQLDQPLRRAVAAERAVVAGHVAKVEAQVVEVRATFAARVARKDLIVELQMDRLLGRTERFDW